MWASAYLLIAGGKGNLNPTLLAGLSASVGDFCSGPPAGKMQML